MSKPIKNCPDCIYGNKCQMICINANCRKPAFICEQGLTTKSECALFHDKCDKMQWSELENIICENPNTKIPEMFNLQEQMEALFTSVIKKVKEEHLAFKKWVGLFGFNPETMNFINLINEGNYNNISGVYMNQILSTLFMNEEPTLDTNFSSQDCQKTLKSLETALDQIKDLYMSEGTKKNKMMSISTNVSTTGSEIPGFESKVSRDHDYIKSLFAKPALKHVQLLYRASEHAFSVVDFHKRCDDVSHTLTILETEYGKVIGGYTPLAWNSTKKHWAADKSMTSFIFSVDLRQKFNLNLAQFAIACNPEKGPIFGCCDICIVDNSNVQKSNAEFPISYNNFKYGRNPESSQAFTGHVKGRFTIKDWQVYKIHFVE